MRVKGEGKGREEEGSVWEKRKDAEEDLYDIFISDAVILFADQYGDRPGRGKFIEFGAAHAMNKKLYVVGKENDSSIFFFLGGVIRIETIDEMFLMLECLKEK